ncbi:MAG: hypothetical protein QM770_18955 [Tepidisphaeraceae bacterium]
MTSDKGVGELRTYRIDLEDVHTFADFVAAFNAGMIHSLGGHWNGNFDAFNDYMSWPAEDCYRLLLSHWHKCVDELGVVSEGAFLHIARKVFDENPHVTVCYE